jgi:hypothetical protein
MTEAEFSVSGFKRREHKRKRLNVMDKRILLNDVINTEKVMDKQYKNPKVIRKYWRIAKRKERAQKNRVR